MALNEAFELLARDGSVPRRAWPADEDPHRYGLQVDGERLIPAGAWDPLDSARIRDGLSQRAADWLKELDVYPIIGSTNTELMDRARSQAVDGTVCLAEVQVEGRGRRGRNWFSPFGANLAVSIGIAVDRPAAELGGVSLVVGLAVLDALEQAGVEDLSLKWPNDVLLGGAKLGGILIEMAQMRGTELVVGIGLNVSLPAQIRAELPAGVADLSGVWPVPSRSRLAARLISAVVEFVGEFERLGFEPFIPAFDARHYYHEKVCHIVHGDQRITGTVAGITSGGEIELKTPDGPRRFHAGEVSLR